MITAPPSPRTRTWMILGAALAVPVACATLYSFVPPNPDQMELNYAAWRMLEGERMYVDLYTVNWPGALWLHMGSIAAFGNTMPAWRIADALIMLATVACLGWFLRSAADSLTALVVVVFYPLLFYAGGWLTGQRDFVAMHLLLMAAAFHWKAWASANWRWQIGTGFCVAYAALIKPPFFLALPVLLLHGLWLNRSWTLDRAARRKHAGEQVAAAIMTAGVVLTLAVGAVVAEGTPLKQFWEVGIQYHLQAYSRAKIPFADRLEHIFSWVVGPWWWISLLAAVSPLWLVVSAKRRTAGRDVYGVLLLLASVALISPLWQGQGLMYHASGIYVSLVLFALLAVAALAHLALAGSMPSRIAAGLLLACFLVGVGSRIRTFYAAPFKFLAGRMSPQEYYSGFTAGELTVWDALSCASAIRDAGAKVNDPDKTILIWSLATVINNESGYRNATRFHTPPILLLSRLPFPPGPKWRRFFIEDLEKTHPFACVAAKDAPRDTQDEAVTFLQRFLHEHYRPAGTYGEVTLYLRRPTEQTTAQKPSDHGRTATP